MNSSNKFLWPDLNWNDWKDTATTLHLFTQIIGKIRLKLMPMMAEWAQVPLTVTSRGLSSIAMRVGPKSLDIEFDLIKHRTNFILSSGEMESFELAGISVSEFYSRTFEILTKFGIEISINPLTVEMADRINLKQDKIHKTFDKESVLKFHQILVSIHNIFNEFRSRFSGKQTPVNFFWGSFDLALVRFSGRICQPSPGMDLIYRIAMDAEQFAVGFWPGDDSFPEPAFFSYMYPKPSGIENAQLKPDGAKWNDNKSEFIFPYNDMIKCKNPSEALLDFCESSYSAGAKLAGWDRKTLEHELPVKPLKEKSD